LADAVRDRRKAVGYWMALGKVKVSPRKFWRARTILTDPEEQEAVMKEEIA
jgi:hypothetical protein